MVFGCPCICIRHTGSPVSAAAAARGLGQRTNIVDDMRPGPADWRITSALRYPLDPYLKALGNGFNHRYHPRKLLFHTNLSRPRRVDSPPISMMVAPALIIRLACFTASISELWAPPSEKSQASHLEYPSRGGERSRVEPRCKFHHKIPETEEVKENPERTPGVLRLNKHQQRSLLVAQLL